MKNKITIQYGALAKPLLEQLTEQGYHFKDAKWYAICEDHISSATKLYFAMILTPSEYNKALERITKFIGRRVEEHSGE
jgi:hypothetical protein